MRYLVQTQSSVSMWVLPLDLSTVYASCPQVTCDRGIFRMRTVDNEKRKVNTEWEEENRKTSRNWKRKKQKNKKEKDFVTENLPFGYDVKNLVALFDPFRHTHKIHNVWMPYTSMLMKDFVKNFNTERYCGVTIVSEYTYVNIEISRSVYFLFSSSSSVWSNSLIAIIM